MKSHPYRLAAYWEYRRKVVKLLRGEGKTWQQIGDQLGVSRQRAHQLGSHKEA